MSNKNDFLTSIKSMNEQELQARMAEDELRLKKLKFGHSVSPLENPMCIRDIRRDIARTKTALRTKQSGAQS